MLVIPIQAVPSQQVRCVLAGQNCQIAIYAKPQGIFVDLNSNGVEISVASIALNGIGLDPFTYSSFVGNLIFIDTEGENDPTFDGLGSRYQLVYLTPAEYAATLVPNPVRTPPVNNILVTDYGVVIYTGNGELIEVIL